MSDFINNYMFCVISLYLFFVYANKVVLLNHYKNEDLVIFDYIIKFIFNHKLIAYRF
jgi:hypothetical protein